MKSRSRAKTSTRVLCILAILVLISAGGFARGQTAYVVDQFNPSGTGGYSYSGGQITSVWGNWFGNAFQSLAWDSTSDAGNNPNSGSMKITANFNGSGSIPNQFEVYDGTGGISPPLNGLLYTNFQCDVRFASGSATVTNSGQATFGELQFGIETASGGQDYFGGVAVLSSNTNWVHVSLPINATADTNLTSIRDVLIHIYGPYFGSPGLSGSSILWIDNIEFVAAASLATNCLVDWNNVHQRIDGFGASSAWNGTWTTAQADMFFSTNNGIGVTLDGTTNFSFTGIDLSLLRSRIAPGGASIETNIMVMAQARGAKVWSTPWSPAAQFKSIDNIDGGSFVGNAANYEAYANQQAAYVANMKNQYGINLYAISVQNEPDANVTTYESCNWTAQQIHDFVPYLYNALAASNVGSTMIMLPESQNWQDYSNLTVTAMTDTNVAVDVGIVADHNYDGANGPGSLTKNTYGKALWETEVALLNTPFDGSITNGVYWGQRIYLFMTQAQANAWHYWWLIDLNSDDEGLTDYNGYPAKRMYVLGNYSRFVHPNYYRIDANANSSPLYISAYRSTNAGSFVIVAVNPGATNVTQLFNLTNFTALSVTPWITSATLSLASQSAVAVSNSSFTYTLPALSAVTFVGQEYVLPSSITITSAVFKTNGLVLTWNSVAGATYSVLATNFLPNQATSWPVIVSGYPAGGAANGSLSYTDTTATASTSANFYRVSSP